MCVTRERAAKTDAPFLRRFREEVHQSARALAWGAQQRAGVGFGVGGGFDEQQAAHHRFAGAQPRRQQLMRFERERVLGSDLTRIAEERGENVHERLRDTPQRKRRCAVDLRVGWW